MRASNFVRVERNTLRGFFTLHLASVLDLHGCTLHRQGDKEWIGLPGRPQTTPDNQLRRDPATGKVLYAPLIEIADKAARERFQAQALVAVHRLIDQGEGA
jgi:hypothetical protein